MKDLISKENLVILLFGVACGSFYYSACISPRDEEVRVIMKCMNDLRSKQEYDRCAQQLKEMK